ncbi:DUF5412 family protein [Gracilibacillus caseinilyticus]|uniref:DUF5412 family protein n=1 Tax=Gracilibacillus caseinilyticus TaxID=2932256 RepID=A0ABY4EQX8_9BACI|nr:DUF5412 family protein [Gracilibacillus caseinilyticus]UOQ46839.1 DUF5412 family protein [Gracilibacillus caseinilyticus]
MKDKENLQTKTRTWFTIILSSATSIRHKLVLFFTSFFSSMSVTEHIQSVRSPDDHFTLDFYLYEAGAAGLFGIRAELDGPLSFKKKFYFADNADQLKVERESNHVISIISYIWTDIYLGFCKRLKYEEGE